MAKKLREIIEAKLAPLDPNIERDMINHAHEVYQGVHPDLPRHGNFHYQASTEHIAGVLYDKYHKGKWDAHTSDHVHRIAKAVVSEYSSDDTKESKKKQAALDRKYAKQYINPHDLNPISDADIEARKLKPKKEVYKPSLKKIRRGVGSY